MKLRRGLFILLLLFPCLLSAQLSITGNITNVSCFGGNDGIVDIDVSGGTAPYTYNWSNGESSQDLTASVPADTYIVTVTDNASTEQVDSFTVTQPDQIQLTISAKNVSCKGGSDGNIDITVAGGTAPFSYAWSNLETQEDISNLSVDTYTVTVTDSNNCIKTTGYSVSEPDAIQIFVSLDNITCHGFKNGRIDISVTGGTPNYYYSWDNGVTTSFNNNLGKGTYSVTVTDNNSCKKSQSITLGEPDSLLVDTTLTPASCVGLNDGSISLTLTDGNPPFDYLWSTGDTTKDLSGIGAGSYTVTIFDANSCSFPFNYTLTGNPSVTIDNRTVTQPTCAGGDGSLQLDISGGALPYTFTWNTSGGSGLSTGAEDQLTLGPGTYYLTITDNNSCEYTDSFTLILNEPFAGNGSTRILCNTGAFNLFTALTNDSSGGTWSDPGGTGALQDSIVTLNLLSTANYTFRYSIAASGICSGSQADVILAVTALQSAGTGNTLNTCHETVIDLETLLTGHDPGGTWTELNSSGLLTGSIFDASSASGGIYNFSYGFDSTGGCPASSTTVTIIGDTEDPLITCPGNVTKASGVVSQQYTVVNTALDPQTASDNCYYRMFNDFNNNNSLQGEVIPNFTEVTWTAIDSAGNTATCSFKIDLQFVIPNVFTPNGDGYNDYWAFDISTQYPEAVVYILDRWGHKVYTSDKGYLNKWTGIYDNGKAVPDDTYQYLVVDGEEIVYKGYITLIR
jgi:gliding motility-associated-like protein